MADLHSPEENHHSPRPRVSQESEFTMTPSMTCRLPIMLIFAVMQLGLIAPHAAAQNIDELRRENQRLRAELEEKVRELEAAQSRIAELERALAAAHGERQRDDDEPEVTIDESVPSASPRALRRALSQDYAETLGDQEIGSADSRERNLYMRQLTRWQAAAARKYRSPIQWHVRVDREHQTRTGYDLRLTAIDPESHAELGDPFDLTLPRSVARRYEAMREQTETTILVLRGTLIPAVQVNPERHEAGAFDSPRLIGPFAEFGFTIEPRSLLRVGERAE